MKLFELSLDSVHLFTEAVDDVLAVVQQKLGQVFLSLDLLDLGHEASQIALRKVIPGEFATVCNEHKILTNVCPGNDHGMAKWVGGGTTTLKFSQRAIV